MIKSIWTSITNIFTTLHWIKKENRALHPLQFSTDMKQRPIEWITYARSYTALFSTCERQNGKPSREEANNSRVIYDANIATTAITLGVARKGRLTPAGMRIFRASSVTERTQET